VVAQAMLGQAEATQETALAAQEAAQAATTATVGQTMVSFALAALAGLLAVVAILAIVAVAYFWLRARRAETMDRLGGWRSGPNALWGRDTQPQISNVEMLLPMLMQQIAMMQAVMMSSLQRGTPPACPACRQTRRQTRPDVPLRNNPALPLLSDQYVVDDGDETNAPAGWGWENWEA
ncbi:MAG: hypothetical protein V3S14_11565, partial [Anaerolineae bacterium]